MDELAATTIVSALEEDMRSAWAPDVMAWADAEALVQASQASDAAAIPTVGRVEFPKPDGSTLCAPNLDLTTVAQMYRAVLPLRRSADTVLASGVCGYRRGAETGYSYSREHRRFQEFALGEAENAGFVLTADVSKFFASTKWHTVLAEAARISSSDDLAPLAEFAESCLAAGLDHLPAGHADARLLSNIVLHRVDRTIKAPFVRWVDDYKIFVQTTAEASSIVDRLDRSLRELNLSLNRGKVTIHPAKSFPQLQDQPLESVYHPEVEDAAKTRAELRRIFVDAAQNPTVKRRALRFALPRLAAERDQIAVEWALRAITMIPWEAARICQYLAAFSHRADVAERVETVLLNSIETKNQWLALRLAPVAARTHVSDRGVPAVSEALRTTESDSLWGLLLRALSVSGHEEAVLSAIDWGVRDERAVLSALRDIDRSDDWLSSPLLDATRQALGSAKAPLPTPDTIL